MKNWNEQSYAKGENAPCNMNTHSCVNACKSSGRKLTKLLMTITSRVECETEGREWNWIKLLVFTHLYCFISERRYHFCVKKVKRKKQNSRETFHITNIDLSEHHTIKHLKCQKRKIEHFMGNIYSSKFYFLSTFVFGFID